MHHKAQIKIEGKNRSKNDASHMPQSNKLIRSKTCWNCCIIDHLKLAEKYRQKVCRHLGKNYIQIMFKNTHSTISITKSSSNWSIIRKSKPKHKAPNLPNLTKPYFQNHTHTHTHTHIKFLNFSLRRENAKYPLKLCGLVMEFVVDICISWLRLED